MDSSGNGHRLKQFTPRYPTAAVWGVLGGQQFKRLGNVVKRLDRLGIHFAHTMQVNLGMETGRTNWPHETPVAHFDAGLSKGYVLGFKGGSTFHQKCGECHDLQRK